MIILELEKQIYEQIIKRLNLDEEMLADHFTYDTTLFTTNDDTPNLGLDSIDALELVTLIYDNWQIAVPAEDMKMLRSINTIAAYIRNSNKEE